MPYFGSKEWSTPRAMAPERWRRTQAPRSPEVTTSPRQEELRGPKGPRKQKDHGLFAAEVLTPNLFRAHAFWCSLEIYVWYIHTYTYMLPPPQRSTKINAIRDILGYFHPHSSDHDDSDRWWTCEDLHISWFHSDVSDGSVKQWSRWMQLQCFHIDAYFDDFVWMGGGTI